jgi:hypothetical protein
VLISVSDVYFVQFVGYDRPLLMYGHELERSDDAAVPNSALAVALNAATG